MKAPARRAVDLDHLQPLPAGFGKIAAMRRLAKLAQASISPCPDRLGTRSGVAWMITRVGRDAGGERRLMLDLASITPMRAAGALAIAA